MILPMLSHMEETSMVGLSDTDAYVALSLDVELAWGVLDNCRDSSRRNLLNACGPRLHNEGNIEVSKASLDWET